MMGLIPQAAPARRIERFRSEIEAAWARVIDCGIFVLGQETLFFEREFGAYLGLPHVVGVASGTAAIELALEAVGVVAGDEVLVPVLTAPATAAAVLRLGARPRFVDIDPMTRGMNPYLIGKAISRQTKAIVAVHLHGTPARIVEICDVAKRLGLPLIEDCAQAHGTRAAGRFAGTFGDAATFSFYPTKNLGALGDGGCIATRSSDLAERIRRGRMYGFDDRGLCREPGTNSRLDEVQAAILRTLLHHLDEGNAERLAFARFYDELLSEFRKPLGLELPKCFEGNSFHQYAPTIRNRHAWAQALKANGLSTAVHYAVPLHHHPFFASQSDNSGGAFPIAERFASSLISLPIQPELRIHEQHIQMAVRKVFMSPAVAVA
jgi:dTDP-3-amino-3,4,6-trideoxy-alpha-D-glucose transaminase